MSTWKKLPEDALRRQAFLILSRLQSGTENVVRLEDALTAVAAERERWAARVEEAFRDGYCSRETYNDKETSCADDKWASVRAFLLRA